MRVHLVDGTYELFRHFYGAPPVTDSFGNERGAVVGVVQTPVPSNNSICMRKDSFRAWSGPRNVDVLGIGSGVVLRVGCGVDETGGTCDA